MSSSSDAVPNARMRNGAYKLIGLGFLVLAKAAHMMRGYRTPRPFSPEEIGRTVDYDQRVVSEWEGALRRYEPERDPFAGRSVLELGPGPDLGVGAILVAKGARSYGAVDVHPLAFDQHVQFYDALLGSLNLDEAAAESLRADLRAAKSGEPGRRLEYLVRDDFDLPSAFRGRKFDLFVSQAAFEHFDDVRRTIRDLSKLAADDARVVLGIDFKTHSRWISDRDPLNIYRYGEGTYKFLSFKGIPNRVPLSTYVDELEACGWTDIRLFDEGKVDEQAFAEIRPHLDARFQSDENRYLWVIICARRATP